MGEVQGGGDRNHNEAAAVSAGAVQEAPRGGRTRIPTSKESKQNERILLEDFLQSEDDFTHNLCSKVTYANCN